MERNFVICNLFLLHHSTLLVAVMYGGKKVKKNPSRTKILVNF